MINKMDCPACDSCCVIDDEMDCAMIGDEQLNGALENISKGMDGSGTETNKSEPDEVIDVRVDYDDNVPMTDMVDMDADDEIAAERDLMQHPFEDDEIIDIATGGDENIDISINDDSEEN